MFNTFTEAVESLQYRLDESDAVLVNPESDRHHWMRYVYSKGPVNYGQTLRADLEIAKLKGKPTRKWFHVSIYRMDSGRYEVTSYIL